MADAFTVGARFRVGKLRTLDVRAWNRVSSALLVAAAGAIHLYLWFDYFHRVHVVGVLFLVNAALGLAAGAAVLLSGRVVVLLGAGGYAAGTLAGFVVSTRWGLFGFHERFWGSWQEAAGAVELLAVALTVAAAAARARRAGF